MTKFTGSIGPRASVCLREYSDGRYKVCFYQTQCKKVSQPDSINGDTERSVSIERTISLNASTWHRLVENLTQIELAIDAIRNGFDYELDIDLGQNVRVRVNTSYPFLNLRKFWLPADQKDMVPTMTGVCIKFEDYSALTSVIPIINSLLPDHVCDGHENVLGNLQCLTCNPTPVYIDVENS